MGYDFYYYHYILPKCMRKRSDPLTFNWPFLHRPYPFKSIEENKRNWQTTNHKSVKEKSKKE